jgi:hypothetical protein
VGFGGAAFTDLTDAGLAEGALSVAGAREAAAFSLCAAGFSAGGAVCARSAPQPANAVIIKIREIKIKTLRMISYYEIY